MSELPTNGFETRVEKIGRVEVRVTSYAVGTRFSCRVDNIDPGGNIARASGATREEAEREAIDSARLALELRSATATLRVVSNALKKNG